MTDDDSTNTCETTEATPLYVHILVMVLFLLPCIVVAQFVAHWEASILDDHMFAYGGWRILDGATLYIDIWDNKPPGIYWINALGLAIGGGHYGGIILLCVLATVATFVLFFVVAASVYHRGAAAIATILAGFYLTHGLFFAGGNRSETFLIPCELALIALYLYGFKRSCALCFCAAGACAGVALLFKQTGFSAIGAVVLHMMMLVFLRELPWRVALRRTAILAGGLATVVGTTAVVLAIQGALGEAWFAVFTFNYWYLDHQERHWFEWWWWRRRFDDDILSVLRLPAFMAVAAGVHAFLRRAPLRFAAGNLFQKLLWHGRLARDEPPARRRCHNSGIGSIQTEIERGQQDTPPDLPRTMTLFGLWFVIAMIGAVTSPLRMGHYLLPAMPPLLLMGGYLINILKTECGLLRRLAQRAWVVVAFLAMAYFAAGAISLQFQKASTVYWDRKPRIDGGEWTIDKTVWEDIGDAVARLTEPEDAIQCWGYLPAVYLQARRPNACRFTTADIGAMVGAHGADIDAEYLETLQAATPKIIVMRTGKYRELCREESAEPRDTTTVGRWLRANYRRRPEMTRENLCVLERLDGRPDQRMK